MGSATNGLASSSSSMHTTQLLLHNIPDLDPEIQSNCEEEELMIFWEEGCHPLDRIF